jgi:DNA helicase II / ATP-dependent DNA helicase PcrA
VNVPARGIGKTTIDRIEEFSTSKDKSMLEGTALAVDGREFNAGATSKLRGFLNLIDDLRMRAKSVPLPDLYHAILDGTGYVQRLKEEDTPEAEARIENLEELDNAITKFSQERGDEGTLQSFLEEMSLVSDQDALEEEADRSVTMMTLHISKGLEYPMVFVVGMEDGLFPSSRSIDDSNDPTAIEEERRLCYVGMTRAEKKLFLTYARSRKVWGSEQMNPPSRFLKELPKEGVVHQSSVQRSRFTDRMRDRLGVSGGNDSWGSSGGGGARTPHPLMQDSMPNYEDFGDESFDSEEGGGGALKKGMRVRHPTYGVGQILQAEGTGADLKVSVVFADRTVKKFVAKYARLEKV